MTTLTKSSKEFSQITLSSQLTWRQNKSGNYELVPSSCEYQISGNSSWKFDVSWMNRNVNASLFCRRKSSSDTLIGIYYAYLTWNSDSYIRHVPVQGHATFSGPTLETSASIDLNFDNNQLEFIRGYETILQMHITILEPPAEDISVKIYEDAFSSVDKAQLFSQSSPYPRDCVITFSDDKQVHVQKSLLSLHSEFWKEEFAKDKDRKEFMSEDIDYGGFIDLLSVIYPTGHPITAENVEMLSKLAYKFEMPELLKRCDIFMVANSAKFERCKLLLFAQIYKFNRLQAQCISRYKSIDDIKAIKGESEYAYLDDRTKRMLLDKILGIDSSMHSQSSANNYTSCGSASNETRAAQILKKLASLSSCLSDIILVVGNARIPAHKHLLSFYSEFFNNMFQSEFKESRENEITLEEVSYDEMGLFRKWDETLDLEQREMVFLGPYADMILDLIILSVLGVCVNHLRCGVDPLIRIVDPLIITYLNWKFSQDSNKKTASQMVNANAQNAEDQEVEDQDHVSIRALMFKCHVVSSTKKTIECSETNIATIVKLADRFVMPMILERCKKVLKNSSKINGALKLWLAQQYGSLAELQEEFVSNYKCVEDVQKLKTEPEFGLLDDKMRAMILESITENKTTSTSGIGPRTENSTFAQKKEGLSVKENGTPAAQQRSSGIAQRGYKRYTKRAAGRFSTGSGGW